jgi:Flp pilus assembly protein CpaB
MTYNVRNIVIALVLAAVAALLVIVYTGNVQKQANDSQDTVKVLVATTDITAGTAAQDAISSGQLKLEDVVTRDQIANATTDPSQIDATWVSAQPIYAGQQITGAMFKPSNETGVGPQIKGNYRAIEIPLDDDPVMLGTLQAGDHVDLIGTYTVHPSNGGSDFDVSRIIVRDVEVIKAPDAEESKGGLSGGQGNQNHVTLKVPDTVVPKITFTLHGGELWFALRPGSGAQEGPTTLATVSSVIFDGLTSKQIAAAIKVGN